LIGQGIRLSGAVEKLKTFVENYRIPFVYSRLGHDLIETENPLSIGMAGMLGASRAGNFALANADLVISVGCRLSINKIGYEFEKFARAAKIIVIDIDETEHKKNKIKIDRFILADAKSFFDVMNDSITKKNNYEKWVEKCLHWKNIFPACIGERLEGNKINLYHFVEILSKHLPDNATVISDAGNAVYTVPAAIRVKSGQRSITSGAQAEMGYSLPAAIGAAFARKGPVVAINGDGSVMMNVQELETLAFLKLPVKVCIMNNNGYSCIRYQQANAFGGRVIGCDPKSGISFPDYEKVAYAFGIKYIRVDGNDDIDKKIKEMFEDNEPLVCEVMCIEKQQFLNVSTAMNSKKRVVNRPLEDQAPFIDRQLFYEEMIIDPLD
jgi:acetolactate synthase-1/2/3 large subunit